MNYRMLRELIVASLLDCEDDAPIYVRVNNREYRLSGEWIPSRKAVIFLVKD
jgi:hypothetical protein